MAVSTPPKAILFGSIGTLLETSEMQRDAFNHAFKDSGLTWYWDEEFYRSTLGSSGGQARVEAYAKSRHEEVDVGAVHDLKTRIYNQMLATDAVEPRAGVMDIMKYAYDEGIDLAFVTSTSLENVDAVFVALGNTITRSDFKFVGDATMVTTNKPSPDIYFEALKSLDYEADEVVAIEDSEPSLEAAVAANIACIAFPGFNTVGQNYAKAGTVVSTLSPAMFEDMRANSPLVEAV